MYTQRQKLNTTNFEVNFSEEGYVMYINLKLVDKYNMHHIGMRYWNNHVILPDYVMVSSTKTHEGQLISLQHCVNE